MTCGPPRTETGQRCKGELKDEMTVSVCGYPSKSTYMLGLKKKSMTCEETKSHLCNIFEIPVFIILRRIKGNKDHLQRLPMATGTGIQTRSTDVCEAVIA